MTSAEESRLHHSEESFLSVILSPAKCGAKDPFVVFDGEGPPATTSS